MQPDRIPQHMPRGTPWPFRLIGPTRVPDPSMLHELFEARVDQRPMAPAVVAGHEATSYVGLERYANRLARHLRARGVRRGERVGILLPPSVDAYAATLAVLKAGAACVPIDPHQAAWRTTYALADSGATALVTVTGLVNRHAGFGGSVVQLDLRREAIAAEDPSRLARELVRAGPGDLCHIFYSPDLSGRPRGVMIEHGSACHLVRTGVGVFAMRPWDRVYQASSPARAASLAETWLAWHAGAAVVAPIRSECVDRRLAKLLARARITVLPCTPTFLSMLARDVPSVRLVVIGGGRCPDHLVSRWSRADRRLVGIYGHAETTVIAACADLLPSRPVTAGRPLPGCRVYVVDDELRLARYGSIGRICVGGAGVARGYVGLAEDTRARFLRDPFAPESVPDARVYLTDDLGRIDASGSLEVHGRTAWSRCGVRSYDSRA